MPKPIPNQPPLCVNCQDTYLKLQNENMQGRYHILSMADIVTMGDKERAYEIVLSGTPVNLYACPQCGYCEMYMLPEDLESIKKD